MIKQIYKKNNFDSVILKDLTIEKEEYDPSNLAPKSNKYIWVICRYCGKPNRVKKSKYTMSGNSNAHMDCRKKELKEVDSTWSRDDVKDKIKETLMDKHGVDHSSKIEGVVDKRKQTWKKKYGVDNPSKAQEIKDKKKETCLKNYGVEYPLQNKKIFEKSVKTIVERFGVIRPAQNKSIMDKMQKSYMEIYGSYNPMKNTEVINKSRESLLQFIKDGNGRFSLLHTLSDFENEIWKNIENGLSLKEIALKEKIDYDKLRGCLYFNKNLREKFIKIYSYPKHQSQNTLKKEIEEVYSGVVLSDDRSVISPLELDIYIPALKFAIEFNGNLWHSEKFNTVKQAKYKHRNKLDLCREKGIYLFQIFEHQWESRQKQILNFIKTILGSNQIKVPARKCLITNKDAKDFIEQHHIQGKPSSALKYFNLEYDGEVVASMTASRHHRQNGEEDAIVLSRLCFKDGINVQGGSSKLFKAFKNWARDEGYSKIISWSDNCWTEGNVYKVLGFDLDSESLPDYFYWDIKKHKYHSKQSQKKSAVNCPAGKTEREWAMERGLYRIWDCGKKRWTKLLNISDQFADTGKKV